MLVFCEEEMTYASSRAAATFGTYRHSSFSYSLCGAHSSHAFLPCRFLAMVPLLLATLVELPYI